MSRSSRACRLFANPALLWRRSAGLVLLVLLLSACSSTPPTRPSVTHTPPPRQPPSQTLPGWARSQQAASAAAEQVTLMALAMIGTPYRFGGSALDGFDCSGLSSYVYAQSAQISLPRSALEQSELRGKPLRAAELRTGDLVFFETVPQRISHVGIYVGEGRFVHAPSAGSRVRLERMDNVYWWPRFRFGKRVVGAA